VVLGDRSPQDGDRRPAALTTAPRAVGVPLDDAHARSRTRQIAVLTDPDRLRLLSELAVDATQPLDTLAATSGLDIDIVHEHLDVLSRSGLIEPVPSPAGPRWRLTPEAIVRFGRLLVDTGPRNEPVQARSDHEPREETSPAVLPAAILRVVDQLAYRHDGSFSRETVAAYVAESYALLAEQAHITRHLPSLTSRFAQQRLEALATTTGLVLRGTPEVLFVCVQNAGRSQMAAALLRSLAGGAVHVRTAGSSPASAIDSDVVDALDEIGVPVAAEFPKPLTDEVVQAADVVITMGCGDACPIYPGRRYLDWPVEDPVGLGVEGVRAVRDDIAGRVTALVEELGLLSR
jgi:protein-tyrosine-phosphatase